MPNMTFNNSNLMYYANQQKAGGDYNIVSTTNSDGTQNIDISDASGTGIEPITITSNGTYTKSNGGYNPVTVNVDTEPTLQTKSVTYTENGTNTITADSGYDGLSSVTVTTNVSGGGTTPATLSMTFPSRYPMYIGDASSQLIYTNASNNFLQISEGGSCTTYTLSDLKVGSVVRFLQKITMSIDPVTSNCIATHIYHDSTYREFIVVITGENAVFTGPSCFLPDTQITLWDGTTKQIKDLTYNDELLVWDFDDGEYDTASICWLTKSGLKNGHYYKLTFSDGTVLKVTGVNSNHKLYSVDDRYFKGVDVLSIGERIFSSYGIVTLTNKEYIEEEVEYYNLITSKTINCFANGILASDRYGNLYDIDEEMKYIKEERPIRPYSEFQAVGIKEYWYEPLRLSEGTQTVDEIKRYIEKLEAQMLERSDF